jgi:hypothetical protein
MWPYCFAEVGRGPETWRPDMAQSMYFAAVPFERDEAGTIMLGEAREARSEIAAKCLAAAMTATKAGAVALSCSSDSRSPELGDAVILGRYGEVAEEALRS